MTELLDDVLLPLEGNSLPSTSCRGKKLQLVNLQASFTKDAEELLPYSAGDTHDCYVHRYAIVCYG